VADLSGVRGVSFWIAAVNGLIVDAWLYRQQIKSVAYRVACIVVIFAAVIGYGIWRMSSMTLTPFAKIAIVQPNIPERAKLTAEDPTTHVAILAAMTRDILRDSAPDLVMWPEAALDRFLWQYPNWNDSLRAAVVARPTPILTGVLDSNIPGYVNLPGMPFHYYNAAILTDPFGIVGAQPAYRKHYLVPIVERVPFLNPEWFRRLDYFGGYGRGTRDTPFVLPFGTVGVMICYESIFPQLARTYAREGASMLANITNDAWFQQSNAPYQHFSHLILRAIETRLPAVRAANTGISGYIDPLGRVRAETPIFVPRTAVYQVEAAHVTSLYVRWGDWLGLLCLTATAAMMLAAWFQARWRKKAATRGD
jgi:apolipoprotein N-acyltransferase